MSDNPNVGQNSIFTAKNKVTRARRKLTTLRNRGLETSNDFEYWQANLDEAEIGLYRLVVASIVARYGEVRIGWMFKQDHSQVIRVDSKFGDYIQELSKDVVPERIKANLPILYDYRPQSQVCAYIGCTRTDTQYHHFAPRHLFDDAENWPGDYLCSEHHALWHQVVTPNMTNGGNGREPTAKIGNALPQ